MASTIWFAGAEVAAHRKFLLAEGANGMALNISTYFRQRQALSMRDTFDGLDLVLYASEGGLDEFRVKAFIAANGERFSMIYGLQCDHPGYVPEWSGNDVNDFYRVAEERLAAGAAVVGIHESAAADDQVMRYVTSFAAKHGLALMTNSSKSSVLRYSWGHVIVGGWVAATKFRELQVWDGERVARYSKSAKPDAIERHWRQIEAIGLDPADIVDDDSHAHAQLAVRSWLLYSKREAKVVDISSGRNRPGSAPSDDGAIAIAGVAVRDEPVERTRTLLPVLSVQRLPALAEGGDEVDGPATISGRPLRACEGCILSRHCPSYEPTARCAFEIPVTIRTKAELQHASASLLEIQMQRVLMARFAEDVAGQGLDPAVGLESERFLRMVVQMKQAQESTETLTITAKSDAGVLTRLFGSRVGEANTALVAPVAPEALMTEVFDAEVLDPPTDSN